MIILLSGKQPSSLNLSQKSFLSPLGPYKLMNMIPNPSDSGNLWIPTFWKEDWMNSSELLHYVTKPLDLPSTLHKRTNLLNNQIKCLPPLSLHTQSLESILHFVKVFEASLHG